MKEKIENLRASFNEDLSSCATSQDIEKLRVKYLGKKGPIQNLMVFLKDCTEQERPLVGKWINDLKEDVSSKIEEQLHHLVRLERHDRIQQESIDITLPGKRHSMGRMHPIQQMIEEVLEILIQLGFSVQYTPEIESEYYNYSGLNYPADHPARDMQDTFYITPDLLLRSHTTSFQQRMMQSHKPPLRVVAPGKCYRNETITARSHVLFHQVDGMYIDQGVTFADLLALKEAFYSKVFGQKVSLRVRPSYFPFVEPGMEIDISCTSCKGSGCRLCKHTGWLEVCGAGMMHPEVLKEGGIDPEVYSGYAWGGGIERLFMLRHGISDIRMFTENDMRFLEQFS